MSFFILHFHVAVHHGIKSGQELKQGKSLEPGADLQATKGCCLLVCSPLLYYLFLVEFRTHSPVTAPPRLDLVLPNQSLIKKIPHNGILSQHFLNWGFLPSVNLVCQDDIKQFRIENKYWKIKIFNVACYYFCCYCWYYYKNQTLPWPTDVRMFLLDYRWESVVVLLLFQIYKWKILT